MIKSKKQSNKIIAEAPPTWAKSRVDESNAKVPKKQLKAFQHYRPENR